MPFRAFGDSDRIYPEQDEIVRNVISMPFRAFGDSDQGVADQLRALVREFQCPFGHSGILTYAAMGEQAERKPSVSMPFRAFGDSDSPPR